jgi:hypothetical protein
MLEKSVEAVSVISTASSLPSRPLIQLDTLYSPYASLIRGSQSII